MGGGRQAGRLAGRRCLGQPWAAVGCGSCSYVPHPISLPLPLSLPLLLSILPRSPPCRVVLDEAQLVANSSSVAAVMASSLWRRHAWVVTGTPIASKLDEIKGACGG